MSLNKTFAEMGLTHEACPLHHNHVTIHSGISEKGPPPHYELSERYQEQTIMKQKMPTALAIRPKNNI
jgi:hypothetical protein